MTRRLNCYLDRFEGDLAVVLGEDREIRIHRTLLPDGAAEGDHLVITMVIDEQGRNSVSTEVKNLQRRLQGEDGKC